MSSDTNEVVTLLLWDSEQNTQHKYPSDRPEAVKERAARFRAKKKAAKQAEKTSRILLVTHSLPNLVLGENIDAAEKVTSGGNAIREGVSGV